MNRGLLKYAGSVLFVVTMSSCKSRTFDANEVAAKTVVSEKDGVESAKSGFREMVTVRLPADQIVSSGCFSPGKKDVPDALSGVWWMKENPLPDYLVTFEGATFVKNPEAKYASPGQKIDTTAYLSVWGENAYSYYSGTGGDRTLGLARRFEAYYRAEFYNGYTSATIVPHIKVPFVPMWVALPRESPGLLDKVMDWMPRKSKDRDEASQVAEAKSDLDGLVPKSKEFLKFTMDQWGHGYYRRRSVIPGMKAPGEYNLVRIMDKDGNKVSRVRLVHDDYVPAPGKAPGPKSPFGVLRDGEQANPSPGWEFEGTFVTADSSQSVSKVVVVEDIWEAYLAKAREKTCKTDPSWSTCKTSVSRAIPLTQIAVHKDRAPAEKFRDYSKVAEKDRHLVKCKPVP